MNFELVVILFIALSVISSLINKMLEGRRRRELEEEDLEMPPMGVPDADPPEVDIFPEPEPTGPTPMAGEFQEVRGTRRVSEAPTGPEFQEIRGARPVSEPAGGREFREVRGARPVSETYTGDEYRPAGFDPPGDEHPVTTAATGRKPRRKESRTACRMSNRWSWRLAAEPAAGESTSTSSRKRSARRLSTMRFLARPRRTGGRSARVTNVLRHPMMPDGLITPP